MQISSQDYERKRENKEKKKEKKTNLLLHKIDFHFLKLKKKNCLKKQHYIENVISLR